MVRFVLNPEVERSNQAMNDSKTKTVKSAAPVALSAQAQSTKVAKTGAAYQNTPMSLKELTLSIFKHSPDQEFTGDDVWALVKAKNPNTNESSVRFMLTELKRTPTDADNVQIGDALIHEVRRQNHKSVLKLGKHPSKRFPASVIPKGGEREQEEDRAEVPVSGESNASPSDVNILEEVTVSIAKLQSLVQRYSKALQQIQSLRAVL